tara:strand:+ start:89 stop:265 length:177 start_codon:yes stop_codon:yes gene_type:complete
MKITTIELSTVKVEVNSEEMLLSINSYGGDIPVGELMNNEEFIGVLSMVKLLKQGESS